MQNLKDFLDSVRRRVDMRLTEFLDDAVQHARDLAPEAAPLVDQIRALTMRGGKRVRPALVLAAAECTTAWEPLGHALIDASAAIELLHSYLLIHDDWMDGDEVRRGGPSVHTALSQVYGGPQAGASAAILAGDMGSALAQQIMLSPHIPSARLASVLDAFVTLQREVVLGQALDVLGTHDLDRVHDLKTGSYTVRGPLALGHRIAGGDSTTWLALEQYAKPLGIAFQLRDDMIGTFGDSRETGKSAGSDIRQGKRTAPVAEALKKLSDAGRTELESLLGTQHDHEIERARELIVSCGAVEAVEARIAEMRSHAVEQLETASLRASGRELLVGFAHRLTERKA